MQRSYGQHKSNRRHAGSALDAAFSGPLIVKRWLAGKLDEAEALKAREIVAQWRERLYDLGWFMKCLNEYLARRAAARRAHGWPF